MMKYYACKNCGADCIGLITDAGYDLEVCSPECMTEYANKTHRFTTRQGATFPDDLYCTICDRHMADEIHQVTP